jgi:hypothetical protein
MPAGGMADRQHPPPVPAEDEGGRRAHLRDDDVDGDGRGRDRRRAGRRRSRGPFSPRAQWLAKLRSSAFQ